MTAAEHAAARDHLREHSARTGASSPETLSVVVRGAASRLSDPAGREVLDGSSGPFVGHGRAELAEHFPELTGEPPEHEVVSRATACHGVPQGAPATTGLPAVEEAVVASDRVREHVLEGTTSFLHGRTPCARPDDRP